MSFSTMKRSQARRLQRKQVKGQKIFNLDRNAINKLKEDVRKQAVEVTFKLVIAIPILVLRDEFGFGKTRIQRFTDKALEVYKAFEEGYLTMNDIDKVIDEETGYKIIKEVKH